MRWYNGSIAEAVNLSKQRNTIFVVFIQGDNDLSDEMSSTLNDVVVRSKLSNESNFLAVNLKSGSTNYTHFAQIYQIVPVPSLFFIGRNGTPLEVVCAGVDADNLSARIDRILAEHRQENPKINDHSDAFIKVLDEYSESDNYELVCGDEICVRVPRPKHDKPGPSRDSAPPADDSAPPADESPEPTDSEANQQKPSGMETLTEIEDKLERTKLLIEARRREKEEKEKELEKQREIERRATGKGVTELKKWQAEQELKQIQEERKREKLENELARQRILQQIAQDRAERRARDLAPAPPDPKPAPPAQLPGTGGDGAGARVQFKLPDGSSHSAQFAADATVEDLRAHVSRSAQLQPSSFTLWTAFPRRELTAGAESLAAQGLVPSGAVLVLPVRAAPPAPALTSSFASLLAFFSSLFSTLVLEPSQQVYQWIRSRLFPPAAPRSPDPHSPSRAAPPGLRRRGNVHRLPGDTGASDDNNTWNGNSTQQM